VLKCVTATVVKLKSIVAFLLIDRDFQETKKCTNQNYIV